MSTTLLFVVGCALSYALGFLACSVIGDRIDRSRARALDHVTHLIGTGNYNRALAMTNIVIASLRRTAGDKGPEAPL